MYKPFTAFIGGIVGTFFIICALIIAYIGGPTWQIISGLAFSISTFSYFVFAIRQKDKKLYAVFTAISAVCLIIIGLVQGVWGGQSKTIMYLFILGGIIVLVAAALAYFNKGRRRRVKPMNIRFIKTTTNNQSSTN